MKGPSLTKNILQYIGKKYLSCDMCSYLNRVELKKHFGLNY